jgi:hypothetical protein
MKADAIVAPYRHRNTEGDQLFGLAVERFGSKSSLRKTGERLHDLGRTATQSSQMSAQVFRVLWPIRHLPTSVAMRCVPGRVTQIHIR